jgi:radical SAM superfamily enzyme YgiQ (UPF0313 family)
LKLRSEYQKFKKHFKNGGFFYAGLRGLKYFIFLMKKKILFSKRQRSYEIRQKDLKVIYRDSCIRIFWKDKEITAGPGLSSSLLVLGQEHDSLHGIWRLIKKGPDHLKFRVIFRDLPLNQLWHIRIKEGRNIHWSVDVAFEEDFFVQEWCMASFINPFYKSAVAGYRQNDFPRQDELWHDLSCEADPTSFVAARFPLQEGLPSVSMELLSDPGDLCALVRNPPVSFGARLIGFRKYVKDDAVMAHGLTHLFSGRIAIGATDIYIDNRIESLRHARMRRREGRQANVLLVNLPWQRFGRWGVRAGSRWPHIKDAHEDGYLPFPFFLAQATALLKTNGINAAFLDCLAERIAEDSFLQKLSKASFDYLVAETSVPSFYDDLELLKKVAAFGKPIILCGPNTEIYNLKFLKENPYISYVLYGEYEFSLLELIESLRQDRELSGVAGLIYRREDTVCKNRIRQPVALDHLPWPDREDLKMEAYLDVPGDLPLPSVQMMASRGCPFQCGFCLWPQVFYQGHHYRARSVKDVVDEMECLVKDRGFRSVYFDDDTFNIGKERMLDFCRQVRSRGLAKTPWAIMARPDLMDEETLRAMKDAGLRAVKYGVESADQGLVDAIGKAMDLKKTEAMIRLTKKMGIRAHLTFTFGLPGETKETIAKTIRWALRLDPFSVQFSITTPFPGTLYHEELQKAGCIVSKDLNDYDGQFKSVIRLASLSPQDLQDAKDKAYKEWGKSQRRRLSFSRIKRFLAKT